MHKRPLGKTGIEVSVLGYGAMPLSLDPKISEMRALETLVQVFAQGVTFIDTADTYCANVESLHHNERLVCRALKESDGSACDVCVATKGGTVRTEKGWEVDGSPEHLYEAILGSFEALGGGEPISLWQHHWPDPRYSVTAMMKAARRAVDEQLVRYVGVANYSIEQVREARDVVDVVSVQNQYNFWHREAEQDGLLEYCEQESLVFLPWRPMGGLGLAHRLGEVTALAELARERGVSPQCLTIAWHLAKSRAILPIMGSTKFEHIAECLTAESLRLEPHEIARLDALSTGDLPQRVRPAAWRTMPPLAKTGTGSRSSSRV